MNYNVCIQKTEKTYKNTIMKIKAAAKINLGLDVLGLREDGYHEVRMIMQSLRLHDEIDMSILLGGNGIKFTTDADFLPTDQSNLAVKAAALLVEEFSLKGEIRINLKKNIPVAAGLAGGSTDAAAVLRGLNRLYHLGLSTDELMERGVKIGADVPFCIMGGTALSEGIGEKLTSIPSMPDCAILLAKPSFGVSTKKVYENYDALKDVIHPNIDLLINKLEEKNMTDLAQNMGNVLENVTGGIYPEIADIENKMRREGAINAMMSGSGPTVFGIYENKKDALRAKSVLRRTLTGTRLIVTEPF